MISFQRRLFTFSALVLLSGLVSALKAQRLKRVLNTVFFLFLNLLKLKARLKLLNFFGTDAHIAMTLSLI